MAIHPPSLQKRHVLVWSFDAALNRPDSTDPDATKKWEHAFEVASETGNYADICHPGQEPTRFIVQPLAGSVARKLLDDRLSGRLGDMAFSALVFRVCIKAIENPEIEVKKVADKRYGSIAAESVCDYLDSITPAIVNELGMTLFTRASAPRKK